MRAIQIGLAAAIVLGGVASGPAWAVNQLYTTEQEATDTCKSPVVWLNLDDQKYFVPGQPGYGQGHEGGYACLDQLKGEYFASKTGIAE